jgi:hypothetical protein
MIELKKHFSNLIVVFEGRPFKAKEIITEKWKTTLKARHDQGDFRKSLSIPDCLIKMILESLSLHNISWIAPPAEADAQLAYMQVC